VEGGGQLLGQAGSQRLGQRRELVRLGQLAVEAVPQLVDAVARLARQQGGQLGTVEVVAGGHDDRA
jgi:hypothetical protein